MDVLAVDSLVRAVRTIRETGGGVPVWVTVFTSVGSGGVVAIGAWWQNRKLLPAQRRELRVSAEKAAVDIVDTALRVAQARITTLEQEVSGLTVTTGELRREGERRSHERTRLQSLLDLTLASRAELQQQLIDLVRAVGSALPDRPTPTGGSDAIVIVQSDDYGTIAYASDGIFNLTGWTPGELVGQPLRVLVPEESRHKHAELRHEYAKSPRVRTMGVGVHLHVLRRDGLQVAVDISLHPTGDGRVIALIKRTLPAD